MNAATPIEACMMLVPTADASWPEAKPMMVFSVLDAVPTASPFRSEAITSSTVAAVPTYPTASMALPTTSFENPSELSMLWPPSRPTLCQKSKSSLHACTAASSGASSDTMANILPKASFRSKNIGHSS